MKLLRGLLGVALIFLLAPRVHGATATQVSLMLGAETARPGETVLAGVRLRMKPHWHTYWRNPGGSGLATSVAWTLPAGITAGEIEWPVPKKLPADDLTTYIYEDEVVLLVPLKIATNAPPGSLKLKARIGWLECDRECVPGHDDVEATLIIGNESVSSGDALVLQTWQQKLPLAGAPLMLQAHWEPQTSTNTRPLVLEWATTDKPEDVYAYANDNFSVSMTGDPFSMSAGKASIRRTVTKLEGDWPASIAGLIVQSHGGSTNAYEVNAALIDSNSGAAAVASNLGPAKSLATILFYAFIGGLILNVMPCVLPVIALKILGFVNQNREKPGEVRKLGLVYAAGVLVSFLVLASLVIAVKQAGHQAGWGMQFGNPKFIVVMTVLVTLVSLNLFGLFEVNAGGNVMNAAGQLSAKEGTAGAFFNGILATVLATPCTAPFLGVALGFAFSQSYLVIVAVFLTVGLGLAAPYVVLSWNPALLKLLPRPGVWMEKFKIAMGFPMLATAVWLFDLTTVHYGRRVLWLAFFLVTVAMAAWIYGEFVQRGRKRKGLALAIVLLLLAGSYGYAIEGHLHWRTPLADAESAASLKTDPDGIDWKPWSTEAVAAARAAGHPVLVDFTADWCTICQLNRQSSIEIKRVQDKLKEMGAVALVGDDTKLPENVVAELSRFGRAGVPLVLIYPSNPALPPEVLPDGILTPGIVLGALDRASAK